MIFTWIKDNLANILITLALTALVVRLIIRMARAKKNNGACTGCNGCAAHCHLKPEGTGQRPD